MSIEETILKRLDRMDKKLNTLMSDARKEEWVKVSFILQATGWNKEKLRMARDQRIIKWEKRVDGIWYDINSINEKLLVNKTPEHATHGNA